MSRDQPRRKDRDDRVSRRRFLGGAATVGAGAAIGATVAGGTAGALAPVTRSGATSTRVPFTGEHQAGIVTPSPAHAIVAALDTVATDPRQLEDTLRALTEAARALTAGVALPDRDPLLPPNDNLILGPVPGPSSLTVTVGVGASLFGDRYGLADRIPAHLRPMPRFPNDQLEEGRTHGDLVVQLCADTPEACVHALRIIMRETGGTLVLRWMLDGFQQPNSLGHGRTSTRNLLGFKDGTGNPNAADSGLMDDLVWVDRASNEPAWAIGGSYMVVRIIQTHAELWDRTALATQEGIIGRRKESGAPLDGRKETDIPHFASDPDGKKMRRDGHIRLANPRTRATHPSRILRRGYSYSAGFGASGRLDQGLLFICFQQDLDRGFVAVQERLNGEALEEYIRPVGGGFFYALPGVRDRGDWLGRGLLS